jgi:hypothetical protein
MATAPEGSPTNAKSYPLPANTGLLLRKACP